MTYDQASAFELPFGKHTGRTLWEILEHDPTYLDWLQDFPLMGDIETAMKVFMAHPDVQRRVDRAVYG